MCGTPNYIAPEILTNENGHSFEVDIWSIGVILYTLVVGKPPFQTNDVEETYKKIKKNEYSYPDSVQISRPAKDLITALLHTNPGNILSRLISLCESLTLFVFLCRVSPQDHRDQKIQVL